MVEAGGPGKLFIGGLSMKTSERTLKALFGKFGPLTEVLLIKDRETNKSKGFAFITFDSREDAADAEKHANGKSLDGRTIKVEQAYKPSFQSGCRQWLPLTSRNRGASRSLQSGSGASGEAREHPPGGIHLDDGGCALDLNISSSRGHCPFRRGPRSQGGDPLPKISATTASRRRSPGMGRRVSRDRGNNGGAPCNEPMNSQKGDYMSSRHHACSKKHSYSRRDDLSSADTNPDRDYGYKGFWDKRCHRRYSGRDGYSGVHDRATSNYQNGRSYRDSYERHGRLHAGPPARRPRLTSSGSRGYDDRCSSRQTDYARGCEDYLSSDSCFKGHEHGGRQDRVVHVLYSRIHPSIGKPRSSKRGLLTMDSVGRLT